MVAVVGEALGLASSRNVVKKLPVAPSATYQLVRGAGTAAASWPPFQTRVLVKYIDRSTAIGAVLVTCVENDLPFSGLPPLLSCTSLAKIVTRELAGML